MTVLDATELRQNIRCWSVLGPACSPYWSSLDTGLSRLLSKSAVCGRCFRRFILLRSLSNTSPDRSADTRSSNSPRSSSAAFLALCSFSFLSWWWNKDNEEMKACDWTVCGFLRWVVQPVLLLEPVSPPPPSSWPCSGCPAWPLRRPWWNCPRSRRTCLVLTVTGPLQNASAPLRTWPEMRWLLVPAQTLSEPMRPSQGRRESYFPLIVLIQRYIRCKYMWYFLFTLQILYFNFYCLRALN